jgi:hypothetical protein
MVSLLGCEGVEPSIFANVPGCRPVLYSQA